MTSRCAVALVVAACLVAAGGACTSFDSAATPDETDSGVNDSSPPDAVSSMEAGAADGGGRPVPCSASAGKVLFEDGFEDGGLAQWLPDRVGDAGIAVSYTHLTLPTNREV